MQSVMLVDVSSGRKTLGSVVAGSLGDGRSTVVAVAVAGAAVSVSASTAATRATTGRAHRRHDSEPMRRFYQRRTISRRERPTAAPSSSSTSVRSTPSSSPAACVSSRCSPRSCPAASRAAEMRRRNPSALILSGGPASVNVDGGAATRSGDLRARRAGPRHLLRRPADRPAARRRRRPRDARRVRAHDAAPHRAVAAVARRGARGPPRVDEPLRRDHRGAARVSRHRLAPTTRRSSCSRTTNEGSTACSSIPRSSTRRTGWTCCAASSPSAPAACRRGRCRRSPRSRSTASADQVGERAGDLRLVRRGRLRRGRGPRAPRHRPPADLRLRRHRPDASRRERRGDRDVPSHDGYRADPRRRRRPLLRPAARSGRARGEAQDDRRRVHPHLRGEHRRAHRGRVPRPGHAVPRPHRVRRRATARPP